VPLLLSLLSSCLLHTAATWCLYRWDAAGKQAIFASGPKSKCKNCQSSARQLLNGSVDLTSALLKVGRESALGWSPEDLVPDESQVSQHD
jgi:hypothetical protein